jgi:purine-nucleoside/S-methyl-5'-thioadenosine phosphorylase / adenosine deaminase
MSRALGDELLYELPGGGRALFTTRADGNVSSVGGIGHEHGHDARERLRTRLGLRALARGYQVHGTTVLSIRGETGLFDPGADSHPGPDSNSASGQPSVRADGHVTSVAGVGAMALAADCLPVALGCEGAVAMIHAGWRGLAAGVLEEGVRALRELDPVVGTGEITAVIGPGAGPCCYEVGPEVHAAFDSGMFDSGALDLGTSDSGMSDSGALDLGTSDSGMSDPEMSHAGEATQTPNETTIDLKSIARMRLLAAGVRRVDDVGVCTICDERFFSHRREGADAGRQAGIAWLG